MDGMYAGFAGAKTGHRGMTLGGRGLIHCVFSGTWSPLPSFPRCDVRPPRTIGRMAAPSEYSMKPRQVDSWSRYKCCQ